VSPERGATGEATYRARIGGAKRRLRTVASSIYAQIAVVTIIAICICQRARPIIAVFSAISVVACINYFINIITPQVVSDIIISTGVQIVIPVLAMQFIRAGLSINIVDTSAAPDVIIFGPAIELVSIDVAMNLVVP
jgi:hypothetical protein